MYPTTHDITPALLEPSATTLRAMLAAGNTVLIVSKPHRACVERLCEELLPWRASVMWRFTIGSLDDDVLRFWEPGAPPSDERLACLAHAHQAGYATSVSCEPMLDAAVERVVAAVEPWVTDSIWIGKANALGGRLAVNGCSLDVRAAGRVLVAGQNDDAIRALYARLHEHPLVRWKESVKQVVGLALANEAGLDI